MMPATFDACLAAVYRFDGFKDDRAPGENFATVYGVTENTWRYAISQGVVEDKDISQATQDDCSSVIRALYWNVIHGSQLPPGVNLMVFNDAVLCGAGHAVRLLQRVVGAAEDGVVGPDTIRRAGSYGDKLLIDRLHDGDIEYLQSLQNAPLYINGWRRREDTMQGLAYQMGGL